MSAIDDLLSSCKSVGDVLGFISAWYEVEITFDEMYSGGAGVDAPYDRGFDLDNAVVCCVVDSHRGDVKDEDFKGKKISFDEFLKLPCDIYADTFPDFDEDLSRRFGLGFKVEVNPQEDNPEQFEACLWWFE